MPDMMQVNPVDPRGGLYGVKVVPAKSLILSVVIAVVFFVLGYWAASTSRVTIPGLPTKKAESPASSPSPAPSPLVNPFEETKVNPFEGVKVNPFE